jgi:protein-S-isoprenylcysteine O-methyltransferase Ste14
MKTLFTTLRTLVYASAFILFFGWLALGVRPFDETLKITFPAWAGLPGTVLMAVGGLLVLLCITVFIVRGHGTPAPFDPPREFVALGPYRYVRNPMYIGGFLLLAGFSLYRQSVSMLVFALALLFLFHLVVVFVEEPGLEQRFGQSYLDYKRSVKRWLPMWK